MKPKIADLMQFEIFKSFKPSELADVANVLAAIELNGGDVLFKEGAPGRSMYFIFQGSIIIRREAGEDLAKLTAPTIFGEMAILDHLPRSASAFAKGPTILWEMQEADLLQLAEKGSSAAYKIMTWIARGLSDKLRKTNETVHKLNSEILKHAESNW